MGGIIHIEDGPVIYTLDNMCVEYFFPIFREIVSLAVTCVRRVFVNTSCTSPLVVEIFSDLFFCPRSIVCSSLVVEILIIILISPPFKLRAICGAVCTSFLIAEGRVKLLQIVHELSSDHAVCQL